MTAVYSKSFFYETVTPGTPLSFMTGPASETWILRDMLYVSAIPGTAWSVTIEDSMGNLVYNTDTQTTAQYSPPATRVILAPAASYTVSAQLLAVFCSLNGYVLSA